MSHADYSALDYPVEIRRISKEEGKGYVACIPALGRWTVQAAGDTVEEALELLEEVKQTVFAHLREQGVAIPEPPPHDQPRTYSGKIVLRVPPAMHVELLRRAEEEGISLNQFIQNALSRYLGGLQAMESALMEWLQRRMSVTAHPQQVVWTLHLPAKVKQTGDSTAVASWRDAV